MTLIHIGEHIVRSDRKDKLQRQQYGLFGNHSAVKVCEYTKKSLTDKDVCYKNTFYGIKSHRCVQMSPFLACSNGCIFCWRDVDSREYMKKSSEGIELDSPKFIMEKAIEGQIKELKGFGGNDRTNKDKYKEAHKPKHFAISLTGEPTLYPKLKEFIELLNHKGLTSFVVSNGMFPEQVDKIWPTQLYISIPSPNAKLFQQIDRPMFNDGWERLMKTLDIIRKKREEKEDYRTVLRITLIKGINMVEPENYAELIKKSNPMFVEVKSYMWIGHSQKRLKMENMVDFSMLKEFTKKICGYCDYKIISEKPNSRVILVMKEDRKDRMLQ